jgi:AcrR family transcriptional regulator
MTQQAQPPVSTSQAPSTGTRARIQQVALELFTEQGYEATSLREIAERLGVTKAALYYHFRTKDDIVASLLGDQAARLDALIEWGLAQPRTIETRREFVRRYAAMLFDVDYGRFMRFLERNPTSMQKHHAGLKMRDKLADVQAILTTPEAPLTDHLRRSLAILAVHTSWFTLRSPDITDEQRHRAALEVALGLVE